MFPVAPTPNPIAARRPSPKRRLRWAIALPHLVEIGVVTLSVTLLTHWNGRRLIERMANRIAYESTVAVQEHFQSFADTPFLLLQSQARAIETGLLDPTDVDRIQTYYWELVQLSPAIERLYYGDETASFLLVQHQPQPELHRGDQTGRRIFALDQAGDPTELLAQDTFDPRLRPWYGAAQAAQQPVWSPIYVFASKPELGITATIPYRDPDGSDGVLGVDLTLTQLSHFLQTLRVAGTGESFIVDRNGDLVASSSQVEPPFLRTPDGQERLQARRSADPLIRQSMAQVEEWDEGTLRGSVQVEGVRYYLQSAPLQDPYGLDWILVVALPETEFLGPIWANHRQTAWIAVGVMALGLVSATLLYRQLHGSLYGLVSLTETLTMQVQQGQVNPQRQSSPFAEIDQLADAFYRMTLILGSQLHPPAAQESAELALSASVPVEVPANELPKDLGSDANLLTVVLDQGVLAFLPPDAPGSDLVTLEPLGKGQTIYCCQQDLEEGTWHTRLFCPIGVPGEVLGVLRVSRALDQCFESSEIRLLEQVAGLCGLALYQSRLYHSSQEQISELERLNQLKDEFVSTVSHELRSPLSNVHMALGMLSRNILPEKREQYLVLASQECERQVRFINDLLDIQRLEYQRSPLPTTPIALCPYLDHLLAGIRAQVEAKQQEFEVYLDPALHQDPAWAEWQVNAEALSRSLMELAHNAIKYTPPQGRIRLDVVPYQAGIRFGWGNAATIAADDLPRIFDKFYRISNSAQAQQGGSGLGLALVKQLVSQMEGDLSVDSVDGWTQFWLWLPQKTMAPPQAGGIRDSPFDAQGQTD